MPSGDPEELVPTPDAPDAPQPGPRSQDLGAALEHVLDVLDWLCERCPDELRADLTPHLDEARRRLSGGW